ncbi:F0F1 ATP synthase subunit B [bacterium]|nr:F0F1 ATP synthase subunit B [bacterium]
MSFHSLQNLTAFIVTGAGMGEQSTTAKIVTVIVGFLLVYWVLKKFAFGPLLAVIDERRERIENDLQRAETVRQQAEQERAELDERLKNIEDEARHKMNELVSEGKRISTTIQEEARQQADGMIEKAKMNIQLETEKARQTLKNEVINMTMTATERMVRESLDDSKHRELIDEFITEIERK